MKAAEVKLLLTSSPFLKQEDDMPTIMRQVIYSLVPVSLAAIYYFGLGALLLILVCVGGALGTEWVFSRGKRGRRLSIADGSAILTGLLLALVLSTWQSAFLGLALIFSLMLLYLNRPLYDFFRRKRGFWFALKTIPWHWLYFFYSGLAFAVGLTRHYLSRANG